MTRIPGISEPYASQILGLFQNLPKNTKIILFGSRAKGNFREGSDIDIALKGGKLDLEIRDEILEQYSHLYSPWKLDIVIYSLIEEPSLKEHIDRVGIELERPPKN
ncbi:MAG: nucleotidyltransferase domain-containing protein [Deltaproteobacteria bacterium]|nr:nucleotidyltransferase domain-containing protein [Deltaproteobacteria bacterium]